MYENSCSYQTALDLKRVSPPTLAQVKTEDCLPLGQCSPDWSTYRFHQSTFEQLKQSVEKAKAALQDRSGFFGASSAFSDIYSTQRLSDTLGDTLPNVQSTNGGNCIGIVHNSSGLGCNTVASTPSLVLNGNCITTVSSATTGQRYRLDSLQPVTGCSPVSQHGLISTSSAPPPLTPGALDANSVVVESKSREKSSSVCSSSSTPHAVSTSSENHRSSSKCISEKDEAFKDHFYERLENTYERCLCRDVKIVFGNINARINACPTTGIKVRSAQSTIKATPPLAPTTKVSDFYASERLKPTANELSKP
ncbi:PREDICTED: DNA-binding protein D-ETS-3-like [Rhagoletis zephyria]|uniref:DNA-binding protein D-ETS-3-like n=1 Tax=Rhagoletis zephyria TaxID=28612 RepID=UPI00081170AD|nr:PREDICTED: DNA-binding protein D-ETS-3-like [Rhagoletis zephyria]